LARRKFNNEVQLQSASGAGFQKEVIEENAEQVRAEVALPKRFARK